MRHFAQKSKQVTFVFSGSNRRLLRQMFENSSMPLYQLCDHIHLKKISVETYNEYLKLVAKKSLDYPFSNELIAEIIQLSERHPRRMNLLCLYFWRYIDLQQRNPSITDVQIAWQRLIDSEAKNIRFFLSKRNTSELKVLAYISIGNHIHLTSKVAQQTTDLSSTAISKALQHLEEDDLIIKQEDDSYHFVDPVIKAVIEKFERALIGV